MTASRQGCYRAYSGGGYKTGTDTSQLFGGFDWNLLSRYYGSTLGVRLVRRAS